MAISGASPVVALNRAVAVAKVHGAAARLAALENHCGEPERRFLRRKLAECG